MPKDAPISHSTPHARALCPHLLLLALALVAAALISAPIAEAAPLRPTAANTAAKRKLVKLRTDARRAPVLRVSGRTLKWNRVAKATRYVLATTLPGEDTTYRVVKGLKLRPPAVPGSTVNYGLRTDVPGSRWATEVRIAYRETSPERTSRPGAAGARPSVPGAFQAGVVSGSDVLNEVRYLKPLAPKLVRIEFDLDEVERLGQAIAAHAANGTRVLPLAGFHQSMATAAQARGLGEWARRYGPEGTFWQGRDDAHLAIREIEFGNETNMTWQYDDSYDSPSYAARARTYALRFKDAHEAIQAANPRVALLAQGDDGNTGSTVWIDGMLDAVPDLGSRVGGWTIHPYGPRRSWEPRFERMADQHARAGLPSDVPVYVTEWGIATDNGRCLSDNYGFDRCMTYAAAATALTENVAGMRARLGSKLRALFLYQGRDQKRSGSTTDREHYFGALRTDLTDKGAYGAAVRSLLAG